MMMMNILNNVSTCVHVYIFELLLDKEVEVFQNVLYKFSDDLSKINSSEVSNCISITSLTPSLPLPPFLSPSLPLFLSIQLYYNQLRIWLFYF